MSKLEVPVQKSHASGSWRAIRSMAVPASVTSVRSNASPAIHHSGVRKIQKIEEESIMLKVRQSPGYFETADPSFSRS